MTLEVFGDDMAKRKVEYETRQVYASIREELYIAAKSRALELRMPMREFIEHALEKTLNLEIDATSHSTLAEDEESNRKRSLWDDPYLKMQFHFLLMILVVLLFLYILHSCFGN